MPEFGLPDKTLAIMREILASHPAVQEAILYGSRAMGNYRRGSDIDLTVTGDAIDERTMSRIAGQFDEAPIPYTVDLSHWEDVRNSNLREHIARVGKVFYQRAGEGSSRHGTPR